MYGITYFYFYISLPLKQLYLLCTNFEQHELRFIPKSYRSTFLFMQFVVDLSQNFLETFISDLFTASKNRDQPSS